MAGGVSAESDRQGEGCERASSCEQGYNHPRTAVLGIYWQLGGAGHSWYPSWGQPGALPLLLLDRIIR